MLLPVILGMIAFFAFAGFSAGFFLSVLFDTSEVAEEGIA